MIVKKYAIFAVLKEVSSTSATGNGTEPIKAGTKLELIEWVSESYWIR